MLDDPVVERKAVSAVPKVVRNAFSRVLLSYSLL